MYSKHPHNPDSDHTGASNSDIAVLEEDRSNSAIADIQIAPSPARAKRPSPGTFQAIWPYIQIARIDHWFKNVLMLLGVLLAIFYEPALFAWSSVPTLALAVLATCLVASSNYVVNEYLDAPFDSLHPVKKHRPVPSGLVRPFFAKLEWFLLGAGGLSLAFLINPYFGLTAVVFFISGLTYNVRPIRTKELPYLDVLSESLNNPLRLFLGWFALMPNQLPPLSITLAYWMVGAFFMATKRFAEYRRIGDKEKATKYRKSFGYYNEDRLLTNMFFYANTCALLIGIFIIRYHIELILFIPVASGFLAYYLKLALQPDSPVQNPEKLCTEKKFVGYLMVSGLVFILLVFTQVPAMNDLFNIDKNIIPPLWTLGSGSGPQ